LPLLALRGAALLCSGSQERHYAASLTGTQYINHAQINMKGNISKKSGTGGLIASTTNIAQVIGGKVRTKNLVHFPHLVCLSRAANHNQAVGTDSSR
jgi:hypothetical protein